MMDVSKLSPAAELAISQFLGKIPADEASLAQAVGGFLRELLLGLEEGEMVESVLLTLTDDTKKPPSSLLSVQLHAAVIGTIATRSHVPTEWFLHPSLQFSLDHEVNSHKEGGIRLRLSGMQVVPIEGARQAWRALAPRIAASPDDTIDDQRTVAWDWWNSEGRDMMQGTKLWRIVESLAGLGFGKAVPTYAKAAMVLGCTLGIRQDVTALYFRYVAPASEHSQGSSWHGRAMRRAVHVVATQKPASSTFDPTSSDFNFHDKIQDGIGHNLWKETASSRVKRMIAAKSAPSALNYAALFCAREGEQGATPASVEKLVSAGRHFGGATKLDIIKGKASSWQFSDETYQMTAGDGRVVWRLFYVESDGSATGNDTDGFFDTYEDFSGEDNAG